LRPVSQERRAPKPRGQSGRSPARGISRSSPQPRRGKQDSGFFGKLAAGVWALIRRPMLLLTIVVVILSIAAAVLTGRLIDRAVNRTDTAAGAVAKQAGFAVAQVHLDGNVRTKPADIMAALGVRAGQPIFGVNLQVARVRLMQLPWVAEAEVKRRYPDDISVRIVERVPYARWQTDKALVVVEHNGHVITADNAGKFAKLPLLMGDGAPESAAGFVEAVSRHRAIVKRVTAYQFQSGRRWNLLLDDGVVVKLPETGWEKQLAELDHLIVDKGILESDIREIDLRHSSYLFFVRRNGVEQKEKKTETGSAI